MTLQRRTILHAPADPGTIPSDQITRLAFAMPGPLVIACDPTDQPIDFHLDGQKILSDFLEFRASDDQVVYADDLEDAELCAALASADKIIACVDKTQLARVQEIGTENVDLIWFGGAGGGEGWSGGGQVMDELAAQGWHSVTCIDSAAERFCGSFSIN